MIYKQDNMTIHNQDCMDIMAGYEDNYFDLAVCDPPYGIKRFKEIGRDGKNSSMQILKSKDISKWDNKPNNYYFNELFRVSKNQIIWGANNFSLPESEYFLIWDKKQVMENFARCEYAFVSMGLKKPAKIFEFAWAGMLQGDMKNKEKRIHPTQKPVKLYNWIYDNYAEEGQKILDTHLGSGSNAIAAHYAKMHFVGCELDEDYYKASIERIRKETRQMELF